MEMTKLQTLEGFFHLEVMKEELKFQLWGKAYEF